MTPKLAKQDFSGITFLRNMWIFLLLPKGPRDFKELTLRPKASCVATDEEVEITTLTPDSEKAHTHVREGSCADSDFIFHFRVKVHWLNLYQSLRWCLHISSWHIRVNWCMKAAMTFYVQCRKKHNKLHFALNKRKSSCFCLLLFKERLALSFVLTCFPYLQRTAVRCLT